MSQRCGRWIKKATRYAVYLRDDWTCAYCGWRAQPPGEADWYGLPEIPRLTLDHLDDPDCNMTTNLVTACVRCNSQKRGMNLEEYLRWYAVEHRCDPAEAPTRAAALRKQARGRMTAHRKAVHEAVIRAEGYVLGYRAGWEACQSAPVDPDPIPF